MHPQQRRRKNQKVEVCLASLLIEKAVEFFGFKNSKGFLERNAF